MVSLSPYLSTYQEAKTLKALYKEGDRIAVYASPDSFSDISFHLGRRVIGVGSDHGTLTQELKDADHAQELKTWFPGSGEFVQDFNSRENRLFCLMNPEDLHELEHLGLRQYKVIQDGAGKLLISNEVPAVPNV